MSAEIRMLVREDSDRLRWTTVAQVDEDRSPHLALAVYFDEQGDDLVDAEYVAVTPDGRRTRSTRPHTVIASP